MITRAELDAALPHIMGAPKTDAPIVSLCFRPGYGERQFPDSLRMTVAGGIPGERWLTAPWLRLANGAPDPSIQVSILPKRVMDLVWQDRAGTPHPGDPIVADLDCSEVNLPAGTRIVAGTAILQVSTAFNDGCVKWKTRYGEAAKDWLTAANHVPLRLRGILCEIVQDGEVTIADRLHVMR